jgi:hypothetical protein
MSGWNVLFSIYIVPFNYISANRHLSSSRITLHYTFFHGRIFTLDISIHVPRKHSSGLFVLHNSSCQNGIPDRN